MPPGTPKGLPYSLISSGPVGGVLLGNHFTLQTLRLLYTCEMIIVVEPLSFYSNVLETNSAPKCINHSNILTLYCKKDSKTLCVNCLYENQSHKNHNVVPMTKALPELTNDFSKYFKMAENGLNNVEKFIKDN